MKAARDLELRLYRNVVPLAPRRARREAARAAAAVRPERDRRPEQRRTPAA